MFNNLQFIQPFIDNFLNKCNANRTFLNITANMLIYEYTFNDYNNYYINTSDLQENDNVLLEFIASPYCEWIIGYNNNDNNSQFYCVAPSNEKFNLTIDKFDNYLCVRFDDNVCFFNKNTRTNAKPADMFSDVINYTPAQNSFEYKLCNQLRTSKTFSDKIKYFCEFLKQSKKNFSVPENTQAIMNTIKTANGCITISQLSDMFGYSTRHISRIFTTTFGYSPKDYCKFIRFQYTLKQIIENPNRNNCEFIYNINGYSDQAHFQREFKAYTGITPRQFTKLLK